MVRRPQLVNIGHMLHFRLLIHRYVAIAYKIVINVMMEQLVNSVFQDYMFNMIIVDVFKNVLMEKIQLLVNILLQFKRLMELIFVLNVSVTVTVVLHQTLAIYVSIIMY